MRKSRDITNSRRRRLSRPPQNTVTQLKELAELKSQGILTDAEFQTQKAKILGS